MEQASNVLPDAAERLLAFEVGGELRNVADGTAAAARIYEKLYQNLSPIVGEIGFEALFARTVNLTKRAFDGLQEIDTKVPADAVVRQLCVYLKRQTPATITELVTAQIVTFVGLLSTFIGEGLTWKLLRNAWPEALPNEPPSGENP
jgi:hypothetical protein